MKKILAALISLLCAIYLFNPTAGVFEAIPDNIPFVGNLDEVAVFGILIKCLDILGISLPFLKLLKKEEKYRDVTPRNEDS